MRLPISQGTEPGTPWIGFSNWVQEANRTGPPSCLKYLKLALTWLEAHTRERSLWDCLMCHIKITRKPCRNYLITTTPITRCLIVHANVTASTYIHMLVWPSLNRGLFDSTCGTGTTCLCTRGKCICPQCPNKAHTDKVRICLLQASAIGLTYITVSMH